jgi:hypothetical protein
MTIEWPLRESVYMMLFWAWRTRLLTKYFALKSIATIHRNRTQIDGDETLHLFSYLPTNQVRRYHGHKLLNTADNNMIDPKQCSFVDSRDDDASSIRPRSLCDNGDDDVSVESVASVSSWISVSCSNWCAHLTICFAIQTNWLTQTSNILVYLDQSFATSDSINARTDKPAGEEIAHDH